MLLRSLVAGTCLIGLSLGVAVPVTAAVIDDFDRPDSATLGNDWEKGGDIEHLDPRIEDGQLRWIRVEGQDRQRHSWVGLNLESAIGTPAVAVGADLRWSNADLIGTDTTAFFQLRIRDGSNDRVIVTLHGSQAGSNWLDVKVSYGGNDYWTGVSNPNSYHSYLVQVDDEGQTRLYIDEQLKWSSTDGGLGTLTHLEIRASRWWRWYNFYADNVVATPVPEPALVGALPLAILLFRRRVNSR